MKWWFVALAAVLGACAGGGSPDNQTDAALSLPPGCADAGAPPSTLACTGLYSDIVAKQLAAGVEPYAPAIPLWSDGADKERWVQLPPGTTVDTTNPNEWVFPVGTKFWKQFVKDGKRVETRLWQKVRSGFWVDATYAWNPDETAAVRSPGGDVPFGDGVYHIPTQDECEKCHRGRTEHILGFDQVELGLPGAQGLTLARLMADGRLSPPPASATLAIGDDGTGVAAPAMGWLHANCGITCHNTNSNSVGYGAGMNLRLDPTLLDGRSSADFGNLHTTVGVKVNAVNWNGRVRIIPGDPTSSLLYQLISNRGMGNQMPPIATRIVDKEHVALVEAWIRQMPHPEIPPDAAPPPPPPDAAMPDTEPPDAGVPDAAEPDAAEPDAAEPDAAMPDAPEPDAGQPDAAEPDAGVPDAAEADAAEADAADPDAGAVAPDAGDDLPPDASEPPDAGAPGL
jgi:hypothetical protein